MDNIIDINKGYRAIRVYFAVSNISAVGKEDEQNIIPQYIFMLN